LSLNPTGLRETTEQRLASVTRISVLETKARMNSGQAVIVDTRSSQMFEEGHAEGALSVPEAEVEALYGGLPRGKALILYCT